MTATDELSRMLDERGVEHEPQDEVEHERDRARAREERLVKLIHDMYRTLEREDKPYRIYGLHEKLEEYEGRMEAMGIEVDA